VVNKLALSNRHAKALKSHPGDYFSVLFCLRIKFVARHFVFGKQKKNTTAKTYHKKSMFVKANEENKIEMGNL